MQFFIEHFNSEHFFHKPHKWFLALLCSPIHLAEMHYQNKYHLNFKHAKKLFVFDISLLTIIIVLIISTFFWFTYNPTITEQIKLIITPSSERIISGEQITYTIDIQNNSNITIISPNLVISLPSGFLIKEVTPAQENIKALTFSWPKLEQNEYQTISITGLFYSVPNQEEHITAELSYQQEHRQFTETKLVTLMQFHRGSVLQTNLNAPISILATGKAPISFTFQNNGEQVLENISLPIELAQGLTISELKTEKGTINDNVWEVVKLNAKETATLQAVLNSQLSDKQKQITLYFTPLITVNQQKIKQETVSRQFTVLHPNIELKTSWQEQATAVSPGETLNLNIDLKNFGDIELDNIILKLNLPDKIVDSKKLVNLNHGKYQNQSFVIDSSYHAALKSFKQNQFISLPIIIPILSYPQGIEDIVLNANIELQAQIPNLSDIKYQTSKQISPIKIGTQLSLVSELRYFTQEGDQLGRGPIPPQINKQTKYWAMITISNTTSRLSDLKFSAYLPEYVEWTGRSSVSHGQEIKYNTQTNSISWDIASLAPFQQIGLYFELGFTPTLAQLNTTPILLKNIQISAKDEYIGAIITRISPNLDISLKTDKIGQKNGIKVTQ